MCANDDRHRGCERASGIHRCLVYSRVREYAFGGQAPRNRELSRPSNGRYPWRVKNVRSASGTHLIKILLFPWDQAGCRMMHSSAQSAARGGGATIASIVFGHRLTTMQPGGTSSVAVSRRCQSAIRAGIFTESKSSPTKVSFFFKLWLT